MTTRFTTTHIKGKGRGKFIGYPTINLAVPAGFELDNGIYAVWVTITQTRLRGAMHWGPIPTFDEPHKSLEVYILEIGDHEMTHTDMSQITVEVVEKIREITKFPSINTLTKQIEKDVLEVRKILTE
jgi:FAD synthase